MHLEKPLNASLCWRIVTLVSALLFLCLCFQLYKNGSQDVETAIYKNVDVQKEMENAEDIKFQLSSWEKKSEELGVPIISVPTGIFIQSIKFENSHEVNVTGYIWQKYTKGVHYGISRGFILPESVNSADTAVEEIAYQKQDGDTEVIGWYFERILRQNFTYYQFPLDFQTVWIRFWHKDFYNNVVLTPDLNAYDRVGLKDVFGIDEDIVMAGWTFVDTNFVYKDRNYDTRFGLDEYSGQRAFPELYYNILLKRNILSPLVIYIGPILVVLILLFNVLILNTSDSKKRGISGFSTLESFATFTGLFFVVMLAHIDLRESFPVDEIVYIEYFYLLTYTVIISLTINFHLFTKENSGSMVRLLQFEDNIFVKLLYWPTILGVLNVMTFQIL